MPLRAGPVRCLVAQYLGAVDRDVAYLTARHPEDEFAPGGADRIVEMDDGGACAFEAGEAGPDEVFAALGEHLDEDIVGDAIRPNQVRDEIEFGASRAGEADLDFLYADLDQ